MQIKLWDDSEIVQDNSRINGKGRVYRQGTREYSSVTTILGKFEDKSFLTSWKKRVGEVEAERIKNTASSHGTNAHTALENHLKCQYPELILQDKPQLQKLPLAEQEQAIAGIKERLKLDETQQKLVSPFMPLLPHLKPVALEKRILWHDDEAKIGFGGTADAFKLVDCALLPPGAKPLFTEDGKSYALVVLDWKNFNKKKRCIEYTKGNKPYFPLIKYALQLSAYSAAFNKLTGGEYKLSQGMLACAYNTAEADEEMSYELDLIYFDQRSIMWFWKQFRRMLVAYYHNGSFDWKAFCQAAHEAGVLGKPLESLG